MTTAALHPRADIIVTSATRGANTSSLVYTGCHGHAAETESHTEKTVYHLLCFFSFASSHVFSKLPHSLFGLSSFLPSCLTTSFLFVHLHFLPYSQFPSSILFFLLFFPSFQVTSFLFPTLFHTSFTSFHLSSLAISFFHLSSFYFIPIFHHVKFLSFFLDKFLWWLQAVNVILVNRLMLDQLVLGKATYTNLALNPLRVSRYLAAQVGRFKRCPVV